VCTCLCDGQMKSVRAPRQNGLYTKKTLRTAQNMQNNERYQTFRFVDYDYWNKVWKYNYTPDKTKQNKTKHTV